MYKVCEKIMAKYTITYKCGCTKEVELFGKISERENKIEWYKTIECPVCKCKNSDLEGTPKQVVWAIDLKKQLTVRISQLIEKCPAEKGKKALSEFLSEVEKNKSAKWFIENRLNDDEIAKSSVKFL